jgi:MEMO1 family protein
VNEVQDFLARCAPGPTITPKALIAPHAGYAYSGKIAAAAFATLRHCAQMTTRVVLIGPAHYVRVGGIAAPTVQAFATPLGRVPVEAQACGFVAVDWGHLSTFGPQANEGIGAWGWR